MISICKGYGRDFLQTVKLCGLLAEQKANMIFLSSGGTVYGVQESQPIKETALPVPINHYGSLKLCIENVIRTFNTQRHTKMRIARISNPFGPGQDYQKGVGFVDAAVKKMIRGEELRYGETGKPSGIIFILKTSVRCWKLWLIMKGKKKYSISARTRALHRIKS